MTFIATFIFVLFCISLVLPYFSQFTSERYGSAKLLFKHSIINKKNTGVGFCINGRRSIGKESRLHMCVIGGSGSGKSQIFSYPNLLKLQGSIICTDIKGTLFETTSGFLQKKGFRVRSLNLKDINKSLRFNPLLRLKDQTAIRRFCYTLHDISGGKSKESPFWRESSSNILFLIFVCLKNTEDQKYYNLHNAIFILKKMSSPLESDKEAMKRFFAQYAPSEEIFQQYLTLIATDERLLNNQMASAYATISTLDTAEIKELTRTDNLELETLRKQKQIIYLQVPVNRAKDFQVVMSLFYTQLFDQIMEDMPESNDQELFFLLDEFANLYLPGIENTISLIRAYNVGLALIFQNYKQLEEQYSPSIANTIFSNTASKLILPGIQDTTTLSILEKLLGTMTHEETDINGRKHTNARKVLNSDEVRTLGDSEALFLHRNLPVIRLHTYPLYKQVLLMKKAGIYSKEGRLYSKYPAVEMPPNSLKALEYIPLFTDTETTEKKAAISEESPIQKKYQPNIVDDILNDMSSEEVQKTSPNRNQNRQSQNLNKTSPKEDILPLKAVPKQNTPPEYPKKDDSVLDELELKALEKKAIDNLKQFFD